MRTAPVVTSSLTITGQVGVAFSGYTVAGTHSPTGFSAVGLPAGLVINGSTGAITGTPTLAGVSSVTIGASNSSGTGTAVATFTIDNPRPAITSSTTDIGIVGTSISTYQIVANYNPTSFSATGLPPGLTINTTYGTITGNPTTAGTYAVALGATNNGGTGTATLNFTINLPKPSITSASTSTGTVGVAFPGYTITATNTPSSFSATGLPAGLSLNSASGAISGTPTTSGTYPVIVGASGPSGTGTATVTFTITNSKPIIVSPLTATGVNGVSFNSYSIVANNSPTSYSASGLPSGLSISTSTGAITGTPNTVQVYNVTIGAINAGGTTTATLVFTINPATPVITSSTTATGTLGSTFNYQISASNTPTSFTALGLPSGLTLGGTGAITGTPTQTGTFSVVITASNVTGTGKATLTLTVNPPKPVITSLTSAIGVTGSSFSYSINASNSPASYSTGTLPAGLTLSSNTISGTPTATGATVVSISATNATGTGSANLTITINAPKPAITSATTATGSVGTAFTGYTIVATNTPTSYSEAGMPPGLSFSTSTGVFSGTPTTSGVYPVTIGATNASGTGTATLTITINTATPSITSLLAEQGVTGASFAYYITASNTPTSYNATPLPTGLTVSTSTGKISGTPTAVASTNVTISATDATGTASATLVINVIAPIPAISSATTGSGVVGTAITNYSIVGSNTPTSYSATGLPPGLSLNTSTGVISGTPTSAGVFSIKLGATNLAGTGTATLTFTINPLAPVIESSTSANGIAGSVFANYTIVASNSPTSFSQSGLPSGLTLDTVQGIISGTPSAAAVSTVTLHAINSGGTGTATLTITVVSAKPVITSPGTAAGTVGVSFTAYTVTGTNTPTSFAATGLPTGLSCSTTTGKITGTPTVAGNSTATVSATNAGGTTSASVVFSIEAGAVPVITSASTATATAGTAFTGYTATASNTPTSFSASGLPSPLVINSTSGAITGTPATAGIYYVTLTATNSSGSGTALLTFTVNPATPVVTSASSFTATQGVAFNNYSILGSNNPTSFTQSGLPSGLSLNTSTGVITGTATGSGTFSVTVGAKNVTGTGTATVMVTVQPAVPIISSSSTATGTLGTAYSSYTIAGSGTPTSFSASGLPPGLVVSSTTGAISGTPTAVGTYSVTIGATNISGTGTAVLTFTVNPSKPVITSASTLIAITGSSPTYTITANNSPTSFSSTTLPDGLTLNTSTGVISGSPTTVGVTAVTLSAINAGGTGTSTLNITINAPKPVISSATTTSGTQAVVFPGYSITASNSPTSYSATGLPPGLTLSSSTGAISGTPSTVGTYPVTIGATNASGLGTATLTISIYYPVPVITSSTTASGTTGSAFTYSIVANDSPTSFNATGLPAGLTVSTSNGKITGTPSAVGTSTVTLNAINSSGTGTASLVITVNPPAPVINSALTATATDGTAFGGYTVAGTNTPTSFTVSGLPAGLTFSSSTGLISGTPTTYGNSNIVIGATNAGGTGTATLVLTVNPPAPAITSLTSAVATEGASFTYLITATNNPTSYGATPLPAGLTLSGNKISGTPTALGTTSISLTAANVTAPAATATLSLTVNPPIPVLSNTAAQSVVINSAFNYTITASNTPTSYSAVGLPSGLSINTGTGAISGSPTVLGSFPITLSSTNATGSGTAVLTLTVNPPSPAITSVSSALAITGNSFSYSITGTNSPTSFNATGYPAGLSYSNGVISGTPTATGTFPIALTATNITGSGTGTLTLTVNAPVPSISSATSVTALFGNSFSGYTVAGSNSPTSFSATGLPPGMTINTSTGAITGTPTQIGNYTVLVGATDASGTGSQQVNFTINPPVPVITANTANGSVGVPFSYSISATNNPSGYTLNTLPSGLGFDYGTGIISGVPQTAGSTIITLGASNVTGSATPVNLTIIIGPPQPVISSPTQASGLLGLAFNYQIVASNTPSSYSAVGLPAGLTINSSTGLISGTPTTTGTSVASVSATNAAGTGTQDVTVFVNQGPAVETGLVGWFKAAVGTGDDGSGNVTSWMDLSPTQIIATPEGSTAPTITTLPSGQKSLHFENSAGLYSPGTVPSNDVTIIEVASADSSASNGTLLSLGDGGGTDSRQFFYTNGYLAFGVGTGNLAYGGVPPSTNQLTINSLTYSASQALVNFYSQGNGNPPAVQPVTTASTPVDAGLGIGSSLPFGPQNTWSGNISEILIYNRVLSTTELQAAEGQLSNVYGVYDVNGTSFNAPQYAGILNQIRSNGWTQVQATAYLQTVTTSLNVVSGNNQTVAPSAFATNPLVVQLYNSAGVLANTAVTFTINSGSVGGLATTSGGTTSTTQTVTTNAFGNAQVYYKSGSDYIATNQLTATATANGTTGMTSFTVSCGDQNGLSLWLRADRGVSQSAGTVSQWTDQSANQFPLTVPSGNLQPTFTQLAGSVPTLNFENGADISNGNAQITNHDVTIIAVASKDTSGDGCLALAGNGAQVARGLVYYNGGHVVFVDQNGTYSGNTVSGGLAPTITGLTVNTVTFSESTGATQFYSQGNGNPTAAQTLTGSQDCNAGIDIASAGGQFDAWSGNISEVLIYNRVLTTAEIQGVEGELSNKYGVYDVNATWFNASQYSGILSQIRANSWTQVQANAYLQTLATTLTVTGGNHQLVAASAFATTALSVQLSGSTGIIANTPVTFTIPAGSDGGLATMSGGSTALTQTVNTNASGIASIYYKAGSDVIATNTVSVSATVSGSTGLATFTTFCGDQSGLSLWFRADQGVSQSAGAVSSWADQSATQTTVAPGTNPAPTVTTLPDGLPALQFTSGQCLNGTAAVTANDVTIITVASPVSTSQSGAIAEIGDGASGGASRELLYSNGNLAFGLNNVVAATAGPVPSTSEPVINTLTFSASGKVTQYYTQGTGNPTASVPVSSSSSPVDAGIGIGTSISNQSYSAWNGNIAEVLVYNRVLSTTEIQSVEKQLSNKYGLYDVNSTWTTGAQYAGILGLITSNKWSQVDANAYLLTVTTSLNKTSGDNQTVAASTFAAPMIVQAYNASGIIANAPVTFSIAPGSKGGLATTNGGTTAATQTVNTNASGLATIYYQSGSDFLANNVVNASVTSGGYTAATSFAVKCGDQSGLSLWLRADQGVVSSNGIVTSWTDESPAHVTLTSHPGVEPTLGQSSINFNGYQYLSSNSLTLPVNDITIIAIASPSVGQTQGTLISTGGTAVSHANRLLGYSANSPIFGVDPSTSVSGGALLNPSQSVINTATYSASTGAVQIYSAGSANPTAALSLPAGAAVQPGVVVGSILNSSASQGWAGNITAVLVYNRILSSTERQSIEAELANQYGVYSANATWYNTGYSSILAKINQYQWNQAQANNYLAGLQSSNPVSSGLAMWFKADSGVTVNGSNIVWSDQTGKYSVSGAAGLVSTGENGSPAIQLTGASGGLTSSQSLGTSMNSSLTVYVVGSCSLSGSNQSTVPYALTLGSGAETTRLFGFAYGTELYWQAGGEALFGNEQPITNDIEQYSLDSSALSSTLFQNGIKTNSGAFPVSGQLGAYISVGSYWNGSISEVVVYNRVLNALENSQVLTYLATKYNLPYVYNNPALPDLPPTISPNGGNFAAGSNVTVSFSTPPPGTTIHYTLDGTAPTPNSAVYTSAFTLTGSKQVTCTTFQGLAPVSVSNSAQFYIGDSLDVGIPDVWQQQYFGTVGINASTLSPGGLTYLQDYNYGYNPTKFSSNGDGLSDLANYQLGYAGNNMDIDNDGISNATEVSQGTNPFSADTDGDGWYDGPGNTGQYASMVDYYPLDPTRHSPPVDTMPTVPPVITLTSPPGATLH